MSAHDPPPSAASTLTEWRMTMTPGDALSPTAVAVEAAAELLLCDNDTLIEKKSYSKDWRNLFPLYTVLTAITTIYQKY